MDLKVKQLSECPEYLTAVRDWIYHEWWSRATRPPRSFTTSSERIQIETKFPSPLSHLRWSPGWQLFGNRE